MTESSNFQAVIIAMFDKYLYLGPIRAVHLKKLITTFIAQSTVKYHSVSFLLSARAAKRDHPLYCDLIKLMSMSGQSTNLTKFTITFIAQSIVKDYKYNKK